MPKRKTEQERVDRLEQQLTIQLKREASTVRELWDEIHKERAAHDKLERQLTILATRDVDRSLESGLYAEGLWHVLARHWVMRGVRL